MAKRSSLIKNKSMREKVYAEEKKAKIQAKLTRRLAQRKAEDANPTLREERLKTNVPTTIENSKEWIGDGWQGADRKRGNNEGIDRRTLPVQFTEDEQDLDMAGLEDLFPEDTSAFSIPQVSKPVQSEENLDDGMTNEIPEASTSAQTLDEVPPSRGLILITTAPHPCFETLDFARDFQSLLGGPEFAQIVPRKTARFELSKISRWATNRGYLALVVIGEDHRQPSTNIFSVKRLTTDLLMIGSVTISKLPLGPSAHFRMTSVELTKQIQVRAFILFCHEKPNDTVQGHGTATSHAPELVISNMATPLGLSIGRLLGCLFPPLPQLEGRQVVAVHNQRDYIFLRRFRYLFALRGEGLLEQKRVKEQGRDSLLKTRMQEIGPRLTLKLRWLKRGTLAEGRRRAGGYVIGTDKAKSEEAIPTGGDIEEFEGGAEEEGEEVPEPHFDFSDLGEESGLPKENGNKDESSPKQNSTETTEHSAKEMRTKKPGRPRTNTARDGGIRIPKLTRTEASLVGPKDNYKRKKPRPGASILDGINLQGGMAEKSLEWQWNVSPLLNHEMRLEKLISLFRQE